MFGKKRVIRVGMSWEEYRKAFWVFLRPKSPPYMLIIKSSNRAWSTNLSERSKLADK